MKYNIFFGEFRNIENVVQELKLLFKMVEPVIVDHEGTVLLDLRSRYFYLYEGEFYPIQNNVTWYGDYYDVYHNLVCTPGQKIKAIREIKANKLALDSHASFHMCTESAVDVLTHFAMDYYCSIRAYDVNDTYYETLRRMLPQYKDLVERDPMEMDELINRMLSVTDHAYPGLIDAITNQASTEDSAYAVLEFKYDSELLALNVIDDWRIREWKRLTVNGKVGSNLRSRDGKRAEIDIINDAIAKQAATTTTKEIKPTRLPPAGNYTNFSKL